MIQELMRSLGVNSKYQIESRLPETWDRQTVVFLCEDNKIIHDIKTYLSHRRPNSHVDSYGYEIDGYVNLNYSPYERDPANRNVRIVYCNMKIMRPIEINDRFPNSYMVKVERRKDNDTRRIGREIPQIPCN